MAELFWLFHRQSSLFLFLPSESSSLHVAPRHGPVLICYIDDAFIFFFFQQTSTYQLLDKRCRPFSAPVLALNFYRA